ncbi:GIY-YIG nuclease family protein [Marinitenerispora sediminis]|uniref:Restriction endonuclease n=1 Tax=Marinitenerispora sediminis TaxID=1931232 RepID=A0A368T4V4_9ACTN|nr:GIY-YIG nuclease family protein [Marinitenerispora sediminis]RCV51409.1 restriction endonuclease [Marinitenerispora sediminis]RCV57223.1 restriction endonuclease [Marinitenerispora sediminis]RCV58577.1 restriction endonuclease [Marinitenerispora sediminis]
MTATPGSAEWAAFHRTFTLSITKALRDQLAVGLAELTPAPLSEEHINQLEERPGVYQLYLNGAFVYVGKADKTLPARLREHLKKISGRRNITLGELSFSCLYVAEDFSALAPEQLLISHHKGRGNIPWNNGGFGNKDPGRQRDHTVLKRDHFDALYPIDLDRPVRGLTAGETTLHALLRAVKAGLPYNFRYASAPDHKRTTITVPWAEPSADAVFRLISAATPPTWQITALMGYALMYEEAPTKYKSAWRYYRGTEVIEGIPQQASEEQVDDPLEKAVE